MMRMRKSYLTLAVLAAVFSCRPAADLSEYEGLGPIYPDYAWVTVPQGIAPLNFDYTFPEAASGRTVFTAGECREEFSGASIRWNPRRWRRMLEAAAGGPVSVWSSALDSTWNIFVSNDPIDSGIAYRLIEPGYEVWSKMGIYERELGSFKERAVLENTDFEGCVNCHEFNRGEPSDLSLHIRGTHGATLIRKDDAMAAYNTKTDSTLGFCVYPYWHPSGNYIIYSTNSTRQSFHVQQDKLIEVFDSASDLQIYDIAAGELVTAPQVKTAAYWETFPSFSPDGRTIYFCRAQQQPIPEGLSEVRYNLCRVSFDPETCTIGNEIEVLIDAASEGRSISFPKPSYDGRYILYTQSYYGNFSIWHHEADLWLLDLESGQRRRLDEVNSPDTESYHNWSSNSRWFLFSSRRDDGLFTRVYFAHVGEDGTVGKPFMLPQKDPVRHYSSLFRSYNVPAFVTGPVCLDKVDARRKINSPERVPFGFRWSGGGTGTCPGGTAGTRGTDAATGASVPDAATCASVPDAACCASVNVSSADAASGASVPATVN